MKPFYLSTLIAVFCLKCIIIKANTFNNFDTTNSTTVTLKSNGYVYPSIPENNMGNIDDDGLKFWKDE